jgi:protease-4
MAATRFACRAWRLPSPVAVVYAGGGIASGRSGNDMLTGPFMGDETVIAALERAFHAPGVKAVVLRVESPGGEVLASDLIDHAVQRLKRETGKPLVVSMGSVAGSGGYYISCHADWIVADRHTRTGSIGVLIVQPSFEGLYDKLRVRQESFDRGEFMPGTSWSHDWTAREQAAADSATGRYYETFVARVANGRHLEPAAVREAAQGRVWMGEDALERHLVDEIGGLDDAVGEARRRAGVPAAEHIRLLELGRPRGSLLERLIGGWVRETLANDARVSSAAGAQYRDLEAGTPIVE